MLLLLLQMLLPQLMLPPLRRKATDVSIQNLERLCPYHRALLHLDALHCVTAIVIAITIAAAIVCSIYAPIYAPQA